MSIREKLKRKSGVVVGEDVLHIFEYAREKSFALPAIVRFFEVSLVNESR